MVDELLKSGYHSLDAKNQDGQTALHLASILGYNDIVHRLIEAQASVNTRDCHGLTPLHVSNVWMSQPKLTIMQKKS